jgi:hypothetical protein
MAGREKKNVINPKLYVRHVALSLLYEPSTMDKEQEIASLDVSNFRLAGLPENYKSTAGLSVSLGIESCKTIEIETCSDKYRTPIITKLNK